MWHERDEEGLWFVGCERGGGRPPPSPSTATTAAREWRCLRSSICILPRASPSDCLARVACHECEDLNILHFPAQSCWATLYSDPFKVHFACNYGAELLKQKWRVRGEREGSRRSLPNGAPPSFCSTFRPQLTRPARKEGK